ncbi:homocysteine S-methyltransferase family protein [Collinsella sp. An2]|uniref:homocysteine S-methyltransferase family protein n=1 Tax=Collinsella sp. An2 TaxID=1965585 RepID=UPI0019520D66|nr:homocysteine S-methyltransferase family protein [Collinsella sp. An2]
METTSAVHAAAYDMSYYNRSGAAELMDRLAHEVLLMQGPMGSVLMSGEGARDVPAAFWNLAEPETVERVHALYAAAGAEVLLTNTFQASGPALARDGIEQGVDAVNRAAVDCARACRPQLVVGAMGSCGIDWFEQDSPAYREARAAYRGQAYALLRAGVDGLLLETFTSIRELQPAIAGAGDVADGMPLFVSFAVDDDGNLLGDGLTIEAAVIWAERHGASAVGVNCCSLSAATDAVARMTKVARTPVMVRPNAGAPKQDAEGVLSWSERPEDFARAAEAWRSVGAHLVGGCCGTTAVTTAALAEALGA